MDTEFSVGSKLSKSELEALVLCAIWGLGPDEAAALMGLKRNTVRNYCSYARRMIGVGSNDAAAWMILPGDMHSLEDLPQFTHRQVHPGISDEQQEMFDAVVFSFIKRWAWNEGPDIEVNSDIQIVLDRMGADSLEQAVLIRIAIRMGKKAVQPQVAAV